MVGQRVFSPPYTYESQIRAVRQDMANFLDERAKIDARMIDFSKAFFLVSYDRLVLKIAASRVDSRVVVLVGEFFLGRK